MLHLFNKVFLDNHQRMSVPRGSKVIVLSAVHNRDMNVNPNCLHCEDTLDDLLGDNTLEDFFRDTMALTDKVVIYANDTDFARIIASWLRSSTNMTKAEFDIWLNIYKFNCKTNANQYDSQFVAIDAAWDSAPVYDFSDVDFTPSFEFLIASAFHNANFAKKNKLINLLVKFVRKEYEDFVLEVRRNIDSLILDSDVQTRLGATSFISNIDFDSIKTQFPKLQIFKAPYWTEEIDAPRPTAYLTGSFNEGKLNLSLASQEDLDALLEFTEDLLYVTAGGADAAAEVSNETLGKVFGPRGWTYKDSILTGTLTDEQYTGLLTEILDEREGLILFPPGLVETVLVQLVPYFRSLKNNNDLTLLQKFTLK